MSTLVVLVLAWLACACIPFIYYRRTKPIVFPFVDHWRKRIVLRCNELEGEVIELDRRGRLVLNTYRITGECFGMFRGIYRRSEIVDSYPASREERAQFRIHFANHCPPASLPAS